MKNLTLGRKKIVVIIAVLMIMVPMFEVSALALKPDEPNPLVAIWNAIFDLQAKLDTRVPVRSNMTFSAFSFGWKEVALRVDSTTTGEFDPVLMFYAPVQLPSGARITKLSFFVTDKVPSSGVSERAQMDLYKYHQLPAVGSDEIVFVRSADTAEGSDCTFNSASPSEYIVESGKDIVNNNDGVYVLVLAFPEVTVEGEYIEFHSAFIEYEYLS